MDRTPLPIDEVGNGSRLRTLVYDEADAFMLAHAMLIAANTAMMCDGPVGLRRLKHYQAQFMAAAPAEAALFRQDTDLCEIAVAMGKSETYSVSRRTRRWSDEAWTVVTIGGKSWSTRDALKTDRHEAIIGMLRDIAPVTCEMVVGENTENAW